MPTYDYVCRTCGHRFEYFQSISAQPLEHCPVEECAQSDPSMKGSGEVVRKVSGGAGLVFKGEGFYLTDYARKGKGGSSGSGGGSSSSGSGGGATKESGGGTSEGASSSSGDAGSGGTSGGSSSGTTGGGGEG